MLLGLFDTGNSTGTPPRQIPNNRNTRLLNQRLPYVQQRKANIWHYRKQKFVGVVALDVFAILQDELQHVVTFGINDPILDDA